jgi:hypothetical protein
MFVCPSLFKQPFSVAKKLAKALASGPGARNADSHREFSARVQRAGSVTLGDPCVAAVLRCAQRGRLPPEVIPAYPKESPVHSVRNDKAPRSNLGRDSV